ncbi:MAG: conjugal transfer protein TrbF [Roseitalea porphyridii]|jgi:type IV secretory pathway TrbF-like protein|uniref:conjugal transfer protein TrbF n=1 Tax=Pseudomonadota TaxID=1224 RepID=UPI0032EE4673
MIFRRPSNRYGRTDVPETPYQKAGQLWDERIGTARVQARNWRLMALVNGALSIGLAIGLVWQGARSSVTPYVVEVTEIGEVRAVGPAIEQYTPSDAQIARHLADFISNVRSLSIDPIVVRERWLAAYDFTTDRAANTLNQFARETNPFGQIGERTVSVDVTSVTRASDDSFQVQWTERAFVNGNLAGTERYTAILSIVIDPPRDEERLRKNPLGIYVHSFDWSRELG